VKTNVLRIVLEFGLLLDYEFFLGQLLFFFNFLNKNNFRDFLKIYFEFLKFNFKFYFESFKIYFEFFKIYFEFFKIYFEFFKIYFEILKFILNF